MDSDANQSSWLYSFICLPQVNKGNTRFHNLPFRRFVSLRLDEFSSAKDTHTQHTRIGQTTRENILCVSIMLQFSGRMRTQMNTAMPFCIIMICSPCLFTFIGKTDLKDKEK